jgi:hypothetical protein
MNVSFFSARNVSGGFMHTFRISLGVLALLAFSLSGLPQETEPPGATVQKAPSAASPERRPMPNEITYSSSVGDVVFPHKVHVKMGCKKCHHQIHAEALDTPHEDYLESSWINCQICHGADSATRSKYYKCSECHQSEVENIADETLSSKVVVHKSCWECHKTGTGVAASESCHDCHLRDEQDAETVVEVGNP